MIIVVLLFFMTNVVNNMIMVNYSEMHLFLILPNGVLV